MNVPALIGALLVSLVLGPASAGAQMPRGVGTIWDLPLGAHARELPVEEFIDFACGTRGGPPSVPISGWAAFAECRPEPGAGLHEVQFRYDDEPEYIARARSNDTGIAAYQHTTAYDIPVIVSLLFAGDGFYVGFRIVSDPRVEIGMRENGSDLAGFLRARYGEEKFACIDLPRLEGEIEFMSIFVKRQCRQSGVAPGLDLFLEARQLRRRGQVVARPAEGPTEGEFESTTFFEALLRAPIPDRAQRLAALPQAVVTPRMTLALRARNCPGCDLRHADLKRADLTGANLAGADLTGANLHGAILARADLSGARLAGANVNRADLRRAKLAAAQLDGAMLYASRLDGADLSAATLNGALAGRAQFANANLSQAAMMRADLRHGRFNDANLRGANLSGSALHDAQMTRAVMAGATVIQASMWRANLVGADLTRADARGADLYGANLRDATLTAADFSHSRMTTANLTDVKVEGAVFVGAELPAGFTPPP